MNLHPMCLAEEEGLNYLLIHCHFAMRVWALILNRFGMSWVMPCTVSELFHQWRIASSMRQLKVLWNLSLFGGCWKLWLERKNHIFNSKSNGVANIVDSIVWTFSSWVSRDRFLRTYPCMF